MNESVLLRYTERCGYRNGFRSGVLCGACAFAGFWLVARGLGLL